MIRWLRNIFATDVYDVDAFYIACIRVKRSVFGYLVVKVEMRDDTPSSGRSRYDDDAYNYWITVSYKGLRWMSVDTAVKVENILQKKHKFAHD